MSDPLNTTESLYQSCTGTVTSMEGLVVFTPSVDPVCDLSGIRVRQNGSTITVDPQSMTCSDSPTATVSGSGSVTDAALDLQLLPGESGVPYQRDYFHGTRSGDLVEFVHWRRETADADGSCLVVPEVRYQAVIQR